MTNRAFFVTGTDTGSGKTIASVGLLRAFRLAGLQAYGMKPVASGCVQTAEGLVSEDALELIKNSSTRLPYSVVNPVALVQPCSPNIAAQLENREINIKEIVDAYEKIQKQEGMIIVEGVGGWQTPVFGMSGLGALVKQLELPVVLVVGLRLGCINHARLTCQSIRDEKLEIAGWIANQVVLDYAYTSQTIACLQEALDCRLLGLIPYLRDSEPDKTRFSLDIGALP